MSRYQNLLKCLTVLLKSLHFPSTINHFNCELAQVSWLSLEAGQIDRLLARAHDCYK
jgi:hypothetical protein